MGRSNIPTINTRRQALAHWDGMSLYGQKKRHPRGWQANLRRLIRPLTEDKVWAVICTSAELHITLTWSRIQELGKKKCKMSMNKCEQSLRGQAVPTQLNAEENSPGRGHLLTMNDLDLWAAPYHPINRQKCAHVTFDPNELHHPAVDLHKLEDGWRKLRFHQSFYCFRRSMSRSHWGRR